MQPKVTIAMPAFNEENYIERCIRTIQSQDYPANNIEVLIADGRSTDKTRDIINTLSKDDPRIRIIDNPDKLQAPGLNRIVKVATGDIIVRMDVHCEYAPDYVRRAVEVLERTGADNVGGAQRAKANTAFQRALCAALESPLGVGGAKYRSPEAEGFVDTVFLGAFRRRVFETVGLWDPGAITNEDAELNQRILDSGGQVYLSKELVVHYFPRNSFETLAKQYYRYGRGRARTLLKLGRFPTVRPLVPFAMVSGAAMMAILPPLWPLAPVATAAYLLATGAEAVRVGHPQGLSQIPTVWAVFPILHASHGVGFAAGLLRYLRHPDWPTSKEDVELLPKRALRAV
jgi:succinoglycan biosynthesis protein ExoA